MKVNKQILVPLGIALLAAAVFSDIISGIRAGLNNSRNPFSEKNLELAIVPNINQLKQQAGAEEYYSKTLAAVDTFLDEDKEKGVKDLEVLASEGFPMAQYLVGLAYLDNEVVKKDLEISKKWMKRCAAQGSAECLAYYANALLVTAKTQNEALYGYTYILVADTFLTEKKFVNNECTFIIGNNDDELAFAHTGVKQLIKQMEDKLDQNTIQMGKKMAKDFVENFVPHYEITKDSEDCRNKITD